MITKYPAVNAPPEKESGSYFVNMFGAEICFHEKDVAAPLRTEDIAETLLNKLVSV